MPKRDLHLLDHFHVITMISNPVRFKSRYELFRKFEEHMRESGVKLHVVEVAYGDRVHQVTEASNPRHLQLRSSHELWHKENALNLLIQNVLKYDPKAKYIAWIDADITFMRKDWALEAAHQLQHHEVIQLWSEAIDLGPQGEFLQKHESFCYAYQRELLKGPNYGKFWHTGYAWAATVKALNKLGGLLDTPILGSADHNMAKALIGQIETSVHGKMHPSFKKNLSHWQVRAEKHVRRNLGYVPGIVFHSWHGAKADRKYVERWKILVDNQYNPETDIYRDCQGLWQLYDDGSDRVRMLRDQIRMYFRQRNEDVNSL